MIRITIPDTEYFDEEKSKFIDIKGCSIQLEHSLISISKWESIWHIPFLSEKQKTLEQTVDYIRCMTITSNVDPNVYYAIPNEELTKVNAYIENPMTATTINDRDKRGNKQIITSELIYYWMVSLQIPFECEKWHINRLLTLIRVCNAKNAPTKKMSKKDVYSQYASLNAARKAKLGSRG